MLKIIFIFLLVIFLMLFGMNNVDTVALQYVFGNPIHMPLILVIAGSFMIGYATALLSFMLYLSKKRKNKSRNF